MLMGMECDCNSTAVPQTMLDNGMVRALIKAPSLLAMNLQPLPNSACPCNEVVPPQ